MSSHSLECNISLCTQLVIAPIHSSTICSSAVTGKHTSGTCSICLFSCCCTWSLRVCVLCLLGKAIISLTTGLLWTAHTILPVHVVCVFTTVLNTIKQFCRYRCAVLSVNYMITITAISLPLSSGEWASVSLGILLARRGIIPSLLHCERRVRALYRTGSLSFCSSTAPVECHLGLTIRYYQLFRRWNMDGLARKNMYNALLTSATNSTMIMCAITWSE